LEEQGEDAINYKFQKDNSDIILSLAIEKMIEELEPNLFEDNLERSVDFGHTFSPALEMYDITNLLHGEAVAIDVAFSSVLAYNRGLLSSNEKNRIINLMKKLGLPYTNQYITASLFWDSVLERKQHRDGFQRIPLPASIGQCVFINDITYEELSQACQLMKEI
jgi:3-dehydroquinate synthase